MALSIWTLYNIIIYLFNLLNNKKAIQNNEKMYFRSWDK